MFQTNFAAEKHFATADHAGGVGQSFRGQHAVAAPCHVRGVDVAVGETEAVFANAEQQGGVEVGAADHGGFGEAPDGEVLVLWGTLTQMVTGGGEDLVGVGGHAECKFDLADLESSLAGVRHLRMLADEPVSSSSQVHVSFTHCSTSSAVTVTVGVCLGSEATLQLG